MIIKKAIKIMFQKDFLRAKLLILKMSVFIKFYSFRATIKYTGALLTLNKVNIIFS